MLEDMPFLAVLLLAALAVAGLILIRGAIKGMQTVIHRDVFAEEEAKQLRAKRESKVIAHGHLYQCYDESKPKILRRMPLSPN